VRPADVSQHGAAVALERRAASALGMGLGSALDSALDELAGVLLKDTALEGVLDLVVSQAVKVLPGVDAGSVTLVGGPGSPQTFAASAAEISEIDALQYESDRGPCLTAVRERRIVAATFHDECEWPEVATAAMGRGFRSLLALPLGEDPVVGSLNLYARSCWGFHEGHIAAGHRFARRAATVVTNATTVAATELINRHLQEALASRDVIGQAKGILRERSGYGDKEAFDELRRRSQRGRRKLRDVAQDVVDSTERTVDSTERTVDSTERTVDSTERTVDSTEREVRQ